MMKWVIGFISIFLLLIVESGVFAEFAFLPVIPGLVLVYVTISVALADIPEAIFIVVVSGILMDFVSGLPDGIMVISIAAAAFFVYVLVHWWLNRGYNAAILFAAVAAGSLMFYVFTLVTAWVFNFVGLRSDVDYAYSIIHKLPWYVLTNTVVAYLVFLYYSATRKIIDKTKRYA